MSKNKWIRLFLAISFLITIMLAISSKEEYPVQAQSANFITLTYKLPTFIPTLNTTKIAPLLTPTCDHWKIEIDLPYSPAQLSELGGVEEGLSDLKQQFAPGIETMPIKYNIASTSTVEGGATYTITIEGYGVELFKQVFYSKLSKIIDVLKVPISFTLAGNARAGSTLKLLLSLIPSIGQKWSLDNLPDNAKQLSSEIECISHVAPGSPETQTLLVKILKDGMVALNLIYGRVWEKSAIKPPVRVTLELCSLPELFDLVNPYLTRLNEPPPTALGGNAGSSSEASQFDWSSSNNPTGASQMTSIKDQKSCGGCWAFATVGVLEAAIKIQGGGGNTDLSEQYLISCNNDGWSCNGGWWAHDYHISKNGKQNNPPGAVLESNSPYLAQNGTCSYISNHPYTLSSWHSVGDETLGSVPAIKAAIERYGPVAAAVCASDSFLSYSGGVYDKNECGNVNHAIIIVGWDDGSESWKIKNSWGTGWGEGGYMRIKWGVNAVGYGANYVVIGGNNPTQVTPVRSATPTATPVPSATNTSQPVTKTATQTNEPGITPSKTAVPSDTPAKTETPEKTEAKTSAPEKTMLPVETTEPGKTPPDNNEPDLLPAKTEEQGSTPEITTTPANTDIPPEIIIDPGIVDDTVSNLIYTGQWFIHKGVGPANGTTHFSNTPGNSVSFSFNGSRFILGYTGDPGHGVMLATVDGKYRILFNEFDWQLGYQKQWNSPPFAQGKHTVTIMHVYGPQVNIDTIKVLP